MRIKIKPWIYFLLGLLLAFALATCQTPNMSTNYSTKVEPLPEVAPLSAPEISDWIEQISPTDEAEPLAQIRIKFKDPVIPLESLDSPEQQEKLKLFAIQPALPGRFRFLTPRMVGFQADEPLPKSTRIQVTLKAGLTDLNNHQLDRDLAWTFTTEPIKITNLPETKPNRYHPGYLDTQPNLEITSNVELDLASLANQASLVSEATQERIALKAEQPTAENEQNPPIFVASRAADPFQLINRQWNYQLTPEKELQKNTRYRLELSPGIKPLRGNLASEEKFSSKVATYAPLKFEKIETNSEWWGRFDNGLSTLKFNNPLVVESALDNITLNPAPKEDIAVLEVYDNNININPWALAPATTYTITVGDKLEDQFGQKLDNPVTIEYTTGNLLPNISTKTGLNILPTGAKANLKISTVNLPDKEYKAAYKVVQPTDLLSLTNAEQFLPNPSSWQSFSVSGEQNQVIQTEVALDKELNGQTGMVAYGVKARTVSYQQNNETKWREPSYYGLAQVTNLGIFTQWFPNSGLIRVNHLSDGSTVAGASLEIYRSKVDSSSRTTPKPCATGKTDQYGNFVLRDRQLQQCVKGNEPPELLVIAKENQDWAFTRSDRHSGTYGYGIYSGNWDYGRVKSRGTIFSDRELYQGGEKASFTSLASYLQNGQLTLDKNTQYDVTLSLPPGTTKNLGNFTTNEFGTFSFDWEIDSESPLGYYSLSAKGKNGNILSGSFRVAEFKPPNFQVELNLDREIAISDETVAAKAEGQYLFGSPLAAGQLKYYVTRSPASFSPKGWDEFSFGQQWFWPEEQPSIDSQVLQNQAALDPQGLGNFTFNIGDDLPYPMTYQVSTEVSDMSNQSVATSESVTALPSNRLIGLKSEFSAEVDQYFQVEYIATDADGNALKGERIRLQLQKIDYKPVKQSMSQRWPNYELEYTTVAEKAVKSGGKAQKISLQAEEAGSYRIRANFANAKDEATATDLRIWISGENPVFWGYRGEQENALPVTLDKDTYQPGETATAILQSPYEEAEVYFAVVRDKPIYKTVTKVTGGAPQIQFTVTPEMLPNAAVQAVLVRQGVSLDKVEAGTVKDLVKIGFAPFSTNLDDKYLQVEVTPESESVEPGAEQTVKLTVKDANNKPVKGQVSLMVVNEDVLQLTGYRPPDLVSTVYAQQSILTRFTDNRFAVSMKDISFKNDQDRFVAQTGATRAGNITINGVEEPELQMMQDEAAPLPASAPAGRSQAGAGEGQEIAIRKDFKPLAYYNGSVITDNKGEATVNFKLPDNLTTWRVIAVAATEDMRFGSGENSFTTKKPLMANPLLPQFVRMGDRFLAGVNVTNNTGKKGNLAINGEVAENLQFAENQNNTQKFTTQAEPNTQGYRFPIEAKDIGAAQIKFTAQLNKRDGDGFELSIPVKKLAVTEQVIETGVTEDAVTIPLNVNQNVAPNVGGLEMSLASTLIPEITAPARQVFEEDMLPFLEPAASQLAIAANLEILGKKYGQAFEAFNPTKQAAIALKQLQELRQNDGGFASWPGQWRSDPFMSAYAAESLAKAQTAGFKVDAGMVDQLKQYLQSLLKNPKQYDYCQTEVCQNRVRLSALIALAELGDKRDEFLADIYKQRSELDQVAQIKLTRYLFGFSQWQDEAQTLFDQFQETVYETGRSATVNLPRGWYWLSSPTTFQGEMLRLFIAQQAKAETSDRLLQGLLNLRRDGTWQNSYANAAALTALVDYGNTQPTPPNFTATVKLAGENIDSMQFQGYENPSRFINVAMDQLPQGNADLTLEKSGEGSLHYLTAYSYRLLGNVPGRFNGVRVDRMIRPAGENRVLATMGLSELDKPVTVEAGQVFDIGLEIITDHPIDHVVITDPLPAGFEAVDTSFNIANRAVQAQSDSWEIGYQTIYEDRVVAYGDKLNAGVYNLHYLVRSVTPGTFEWPGAEVYLKYAPEEFGRSATSTLEVKE
jgi:uncharacterized protein YfaS (alpha-2-macroglobulin family)